MIDKSMVLVVLLIGFFGCASGVEEALYPVAVDLSNTPDSSMEGSQIVLQDSSQEAIQETSLPQVVYVPIFEDPSQFTDSYFIESTLVYTYRSGMVYQVVTTPNFITDIMLEPGEYLVSSPAAGDTERWILGEASSGENEHARTHIYVKPLMAGLKTNYIIATNRRVYHLDLTSSLLGGMRSVGWNYPTGFNRLSRAPQEPPQSGVPLDRLDWGYRVSDIRGNPPWKEVRIATDGAKSYIFFPYRFSHGEAPILFAQGEDKSVEVINYRVYNNYYEVDRFLVAGELRSGKRGEEQVHFEWEGGGR